MWLIWTSYWVRGALLKYTRVELVKRINKQLLKFYTRVIVFSHILFLVLEDEYTRNAFEQEIRIMMKLKSENIIKILDVNETKSNFYVILEIANQGTLRDIMKNRKANKQPLTENEVIKYVIQLLNGFGEMFKFGVIHR